MTYRRFDAPYFKEPALKKFCRLLGPVVGLAVLSALSVSPVLAKDKGHDKHRVEHGDDDRGGGPIVVRIPDDRRTIVYEYYDTEMRGGRCPPGLAKKNNGCMPPGQAKKYVIGRSLPRDVIYYEVPQPILVDLGPPPRGYRYVRVSNDILMLAVGTGMVVDALQNLGVGR